MDIIKSEVELPGGIQGVFNAFVLLFIASVHDVITFSFDSFARMRTLFENAHGLCQLCICFCLAGMFSTIMTSFVLSVIFRCRFEFCRRLAGVT